MFEDVWKLYDIPSAIKIASLKANSLIVTKHGELVNWLLRTSIECCTSIEDNTITCQSLRRE